MGVILRYKELIETYKTRGHRIRHLESYKYLFPIKSSSILAGIVADLICDGNLQGESKWRFDFTSKDIPELLRFEKEIFSLFEIKGKIRKCVSNNRGITSNMGFNCSPIARILFLVGVPSGQKVLQYFSIPSWIKEDKKLFRTFCRRVFTCEGGITHPDRKTPQIRLEMWKAESIEENMIGELAFYLKKYFNISSKVVKRKVYNVRKDDIITKPTRMYITGESVITFSKEIGFEGEKQKKLVSILGLS